MFTLMQGVNGFGTAGTVQEQATLQRATRDINTNNGEELESRHVEQTAPQGTLGSFPGDTVSLREKLQGQQSAEEKSSREKYIGAPKPEPSHLEKLEAESRKKMAETRQATERFLLNSATYGRRGDSSEHNGLASTSASNVEPVNIKV
ncbi:MAG: hypothetical protein H7833_01525 [Magnetococcus sp. DMHC-1]